MENRRAFSLVELLIVISVLGILAAIVLPTLQSHSQKAKEAAAKDNLRILRNAIELYAIHHNDTPPGYNNNDSTTTPNYWHLFSQLVVTTRSLPNIPRNPFNGIRVIRVLENDAVLDEDAFTLYGPDMYGWIYHPASRTIKLHWHGVDTDSEEQKFFDY